MKKVALSVLIAGAVFGIWVGVTSYLHQEFAEKNYVQQEFAAKDHSHAVDVSELSKCIRPLEVYFYDAEGNQLGTYTYGTGIIYGNYVISQAELVYPESAGVDPDLVAQTFFVLTPDFAQDGNPGQITIDNVELLKGVYLTTGIVVFKRPETKVFPPPEECRPSIGGFSDISLGEDLWRAAAFPRMSVAVYKTQVVIASESVLFVNGRPELGDAGSAVFRLTDDGEFELVGMSVIDPEATVMQKTPVLSFEYILEQIEENTDIDLSPEEGK